ncbi:MAG: Cof-type HAD-IIB family hydrolase, partial [Oscillospiraceae bacterium]|nr:Cof-type HAD-IIB family hydrolase [Oscillospiraceae bacterium]
MKIKMIVTDLDGTLLRSDKTISERTISALKKCRGKGIKTAYATGRGASSKIFAPDELFDGYVRMNGAAAYDGETLIYSRFMPIEKLRGLLTAADSAGYKIAVEYGDAHHTNFNITEKWPEILHYEKADFNKINSDVEKLYALAETPQVVELIKKHLADGLHLWISNDGFAMIMHEEATKSRAVAVLAEKWGINRNEIAAFGDDTNDIDLLEYCGVGIAMENALDEVKAAAGFICDTNDNDGIAKWLEENVLEPVGADSISARRSNESILRADIESAPTESRFIRIRKMT